MAQNRPERAPIIPADVIADLELIARRLGCDEGEWLMQFKLVGGRFVRAYLHHGPIKRDELVELAQSIAAAA